MPWVNWEFIRLDTWRLREAPRWWFPGDFRSLFSEVLWWGSETNQRPFNVKISQQRFQRAVGIVNCCCLFFYSFLLSYFYYFYLLLLTYFILFESCPGCLSKMLDCKSEVHVFRCCGHISWEPPTRYDRSMHGPVLFVCAIAMLSEQEHHAHWYT